MKVLPEQTNYSTRPDDGINEEIFDLVLGKLIENLSKSISLEFGRGTDEKLFFMPKLTHLDLTQKTDLARDLSELLFNRRNMRDSLDLRSSLESIKNFQELEKQQDLIQKIQKGEELQITKREAETLIKLIFLQCNDSESWVFKADLCEIQDQYIHISRQLKKSLSDLHKVKTDLVEVQEASKCLDTQHSFLHSKGKILEKQIEDYLIEEFIIDEQTSQLTQELLEAETMLKALKIQSM